MIIDIPRLSLAVYSTPLIAASHLAKTLGTKLYFKRDDLISFGLGGNKIRGLEFIVADALAQQADTLVTGAGVQSNHVRATAAVAAYCGLDCQWGNAPDAVEGNYRLTKMLGASMYFTRDNDRSSVDMGIINLAQTLPHSYAIPRGGACALSVLGHLLAVQELYAQCQAQAIFPDVIVLAGGWGGTCAGWLLGIECLKLPWRVACFSVSRPASELRIQIARLANEAAQLLKLTCRFDPQTIAINDEFIGAGYGIPSAEALTHLNIATTIIGRSQRILSAFDVEMAARVAQHLFDKGVKLLLSTQMGEILTQDQRVTGVLTTTGQRVDADIVVLAMGIKPNVELAQHAGIALGTTGAIHVNQQMATDISGIYAAGDCAESINRITGTAIWQPLGDTANLQARVAGENAAGGKAIFQGCFGTTILKAFDFNIAITGLSETAARQHGFEPIAVEINATDRARYYPNAKSSTLKLIADTNSGKLLGAQAVGGGASDKLIDIVATALLGKLSCADLENADFAYYPPFSPVLSPVIVAAGILNDQLNNGGLL
jgi:1-aminocyclopropane-1-carboxylate deaminase/D-cysteine desulfhydrase-like pyridoxal-dependent ACC family enzyme